MVPGRVLDVQKVARGVLALGEIFKVFAEDQRLVCHGRQRQRGPSLEHVVAKVEEIQSLSDVGGCLEAELRIGMLVVEDFLRPDRLKGARYRIPEHRGAAPRRGKYDAEHCH